MRAPSLPQPSRGAVNIRRSVVVLPALLVVASLLAAAAPVDAAARRIALGIWDPKGNDNIAVFDQFTADMNGIKPAIWNVRSQWGNPDNKWFPSSMANKAKARGAVLMVTWSPVKPPMNEETGFYSRYKRIALGKHDRYIKRWARQAKRFNYPIIMRMAHEFNVSFFPWSVDWGKFYNPNTGERTTRNDNNAYWFKRAWRRVVNLFRRVGAYKVRFAWTPAQKSCRGCNPYKAWYPGNKFVHFVGFSTFNWGDYKQVGAFRNFEETVVQPLSKFKQFTRKPVIIAEVGTTDQEPPAGELDKDEWIKQGYRKIWANYPQVRAIVYQDVEFIGEAHEHPSWGLDFCKSGCNAVAAYREIASLWKFKGRVNWKGVIR